MSGCARVAFIPHFLQNHVEHSVDTDGGKSQSDASQGAGGQPQDRRCRSEGILALGGYGGGCQVAAMGSLSLQAPKPPGCQDL